MQEQKFIPLKQTRFSIIVRLYLLKESKNNGGRDFGYHPGMER